MELGARAEALGTELVAPLVCGGQVALQRPFGPKQAVEIGVERTIIDDEVRTKLDNARLVAARKLVAVDVLPPLTPAEWAIAAALNDLLQTTNHELSSVVSRGRHVELLEATVQLCVSIPGATTLEQALSRHATFGRALQLHRVDTDVTWWLGKDSFRGQPPAARLLAWPGLRKVQVHNDHVAIADMHMGVPINRDAFVQALRVWLHNSPLTDLATAGRAAPSFCWSPATLALCSSVAGCNLVLRALLLNPNQLADTSAALLRAAKTQLDPGSDGGRWAGYLVKQIAGARATWLAS